MKKLLLLFLAVFALDVSAPAPVFAQSGDDDEDYEDYEEEEDYSGEDDSDGSESDSDESDESDDYDAEAADADAISREEAAISAQGVDLYENSEGVDEEGGLFKLDADAAETFKTMTAMERANALMKLKIEQEKLSLDLEKQRAEKKKIAISLQEAENVRRKKEEEASLAAAAAEAKLQKEQDAAAAEEEEKRQKADLNRQILAKVQAADLNDPDQLNAVAQLMALSPTASPDAAEALSSLKSKPQGKSFEDKYALKSIIGAGGSLSANIENKEKSATTRVKKGSFIEDWTVEGITASSVLLKKGDQSKIMSLN
ncbi:MAG: hypothetical protein LBH41_00460 [Rickettsiales bacterium]|jgi:hypothetical protein|nr:hypothetical protein [Rickettsiales bacterium]